MAGCSSAPMGARCSAAEHDSAAGRRGQERIKVGVGAIQGILHLEISARLDGKLVVGHARMPGCMALLVGLVQMGLQLVETAGLLGLNSTQIHAAPADWLECRGLEGLDDPKGAVGLNFGLDRLPRLVRRGRWRRLVVRGVLFENLLAQGHIGPIPALRRGVACPAADVARSCGRVGGKGDGAPAVIDAGLAEVEHVGRFEKGLKRLLEARQIEG